MDDEMKNFADNYYSVTSVNDFDNSRDVEILKYKYFMLGCELIYNKLRESQNSSTSDEALHIGSVGTRLFGVYSPEEDLLAVHVTDQGAEENKKNYEKHNGEGFHVDYVMLQP